MTSLAREMTLSSREKKFLPILLFFCKTPLFATVSATYFSKSVVNKNNLGMLKSIQFLNQTQRF